MPLFTVIFFLLVSFNSAVAQNVLVTGAAATAGTAAEEPVSLDGLAPEDVGGFLSLLSDEEARRLLFDRLKAEREAAENETLTSRVSSMAMSASFLERIRSGSKVALDNIAGIRADLARFGEVREHAFYLITDVEGWPRMIEGIVNLVMMFLIGFLARYLVWRAMAGVTWQMTTLQTDRLRMKLPALGGLFIIDLITLAVFTGAAYATSLFFFDRFNPMRLLFIAALGTAVVALFGRAVASALFSPENPHLRPVRLSTRNARVFAHCLTLLALSASACYFFYGMFQLLAVPEPLLLLWSLVCGLFFAFGLGVGVLCLSFGRTAEDTAEFADTGIVATILPELKKRAKLILLGSGTVLFFFWAVRTVGEELPAANGAVICLAGVGLFAWLYALDFRSSTGLAAHGSSEVRAMIRQRPLAVQFVAVVSGAIGILGFLQVIGLDFYGYAQTPSGSVIARNLFELVVILFLAFIAWGILSGLLQRFIRNEHEKALAARGDSPLDDEGGTGVVSSRLGTLLPIFRGFALVFIVAVTAMSALSAVGINIGPLLAGAGVVGIAIGFGAQALVRDIFSGIFFLVDDAFRVGEYVEFAEYRGEIEQLSIRSMRLRHHRGAVHTIPFGELRAITNHNRDWVIYKQEFQVPYEADIEKIRKIVKRIGQELLQDPVHGPKMLAPLKSQGVRRVENGVLVIATKFKCRPREQWVIRRVVYQRVRDELYKEGIELAHRRVQVEMPLERSAEREDDDRAQAESADAPRSGAQSVTPLAPRSDERFSDLSPQSLGAAAVQAAIMAAAVEDEQRPKKANE